MYEIDSTLIELMQQQHSARSRPWDKGGGGGVQSSRPFSQKGGGAGLQNIFFWPWSKNKRGVGQRPPGPSPESSTATTSLFSITISIQ